MEYKTKPIVVEAWHFTKEDMNHVFWTLSDRQYNISPSFDDNAEPVMLIPTSFGERIVHLGDYVIKGVNGEFYPCKPDIFEKLYDVAVELDTPIITATKTNKNQE